MVTARLAPAGLRQRRERRTRRLLAQRSVLDALLSVAGLVGRSVLTADAAEVGHLLDVVIKWDGGTYPPVSGIVARVGRRRAFVPVEQVAEIQHDRVLLSSARLDLRDFARREGEVLLMKDVVDHQLVDVDGVRVVRPSDLYLACVATRWRLVGADVSLASLVRRLGPARWRTKPTPERVIDWAAIQPLGTGGPTQLQLREPNRELHRLRPAELADLLEELGRQQRQDLLDALGPETAADALEEMEADDLEALLRDAGPARAAQLIGDMEPDEAADALRDLDDEERAAVLDALPPAQAAELGRLLAYEEDRAGGIMTTHLVTVPPELPVRDVRKLLRDHDEHRADIDAITVVDRRGKMLDDIGLFRLVTASPSQPIGDLVGVIEPVTVPPDASLRDVVEKLVDNRESSVLVVDDEGRPVGRILADDVIDALTERGRLRLARVPA